MKSTISHLGTQNFPRLRIGIGKPKSDSGTSGGETVSYVLGKFSPSEIQVMEQVLQWVGESIDLSVRQGVEKAMSLYNNRSCC
jgi:PTH1 family peptidyl-tRNA hydrolase